MGKLSKKILATLMVFAMLFGSVPALAGATITIDGTTPHPEYSGDAKHGIDADGTHSSTYSVGEVDSITTAEGLTCEVVNGINNNGTGTLTIGSLTGGMSLTSTSTKMVVGISAGNSSTKTEVNGLGNMSITNTGNMALGIFSEKETAGAISVSFVGANSTVNIAGKTSSVFLRTASSATITGADSRTKVTFNGAGGTICGISLGHAANATLTNMDITDEKLSGESGYAFYASSTTGDGARLTLNNTLLKGNVYLNETVATVNVNKDSVFSLGNVTSNAPATDSLTLNINDGGTLAFYKTTEATTTLPSCVTTNLNSGSKLAFYLDDFAKDSTIADASACPINISSTKVELWQEKTPLLQKEDTLTLLKGAEGSYTAKDLTTLHEGQGIQTYKYNTYLTGDSLMAKYLGTAGPAEESKSLSEGFIAGSVALLQAGDLASGEAIAAAQTATETSIGRGFTPYAVIQGGHGRYNTGSHIDMNSVQIAAGVAKRFGSSTIGGLLIEGGNGRYTSYNEFTSGELRADGEVKYYGVGIFGKHAFSKSDKGNAYVDASFSFGRTDQDYRTADIAGIKDYHYDIGVIYLKAHATAGYEWNLGKASLDGYVKYLWACQNGATINFNGQDVNFDTINSHRVRVGARYTQKIQEALSWYGGLAYEYEFDASAGANSQGLAIAEPDLRGASGMAEVGLKYSPLKAKNWMFDLGLEGFTGKKDSLSVRLSTWYTF